MKRKRFVPIQQPDARVVKWILLVMTAWPLILASAIAYSATMTLAWDANSEPEVTGYKVYYGAESRNYSYAVDIGNYTSCTVSDLEPGKTYYFAVTAYDIENNESAFSEEIQYEVPSSADRKAMPWIPLLLLHD